MNRQEKEQVIKSLKDNFSASQASFVVGYQGLTVQDLMNLRTQLREQGGSFKVAKVNLIKLALDGLEGVDELVPSLDGQIGFVFADQEVPAVAKSIHTFSKENESLRLLAGFFEKNVLNEQQIKALATLPPREVLLGQLCGVLQAPTAGLARALQMLIVRLAVVLKKIEEKKASESS